MQAFVAATISLGVWTLIIVATFASRFAGAIVERNMFVLAPLLLIGLLVWIDRGAPRPRVYVIAAACIAAVLPALIPYERFLQLKVRSDTLMIVPLWNVQDHVGLSRLDEVVLLGGIVAAALFVFVPRRYLLVLPAFVLVYFAAAIQPIQAARTGWSRRRPARSSRGSASRTGPGSTIRSLPMTSRCSGPGRRIASPCS